MTDKAHKNQVKVVIDIKPAQPGPDQRQAWDTFWARMIAEAREQKGVSDGRQTT